MPQAITWPEGKRFAFSVFDDTDSASVERLADVYALLRDCGMRTTKSVWPLAGTAAPEVVGGATCADTKYLAWLRGLQKVGFEIGFHNATYHSSPRQDTLRGLDEFKRLFGHDPYTMATHTTCREGMYWGADRVSGMNRLLYKMVTLNRQSGWFRGHLDGDTYFWGDLCRDRVRYVRNFVFDEINTLKACPCMPYHDADRSWVSAWFASSEGGKAQSFNATLSEANQDRLEAEGGACIMYTHFAKGFCVGGKLEPRFKQLIERLGRKNGWFVPVNTLLDYLRDLQGLHSITRSERAGLERKWLRYKFKVGTT